MVSSDQTKSFDLSQLATRRYDFSRGLRWIAAVFLPVFAIIFFGIFGVGRAVLALVQTGVFPYGPDGANVILLFAGVFFCWLFASNLYGARFGPTTLVLDNAGITFIYPSGRSRRYSWRNSGFHLDLYDFRNCSVGSVTDAAWAVTWSGAILSPLTEESLEAIKEKAAAHGLEVRKGKESLLKRLSEKMTIPYCTDVYRLRR